MSTHFVYTGLRTCMFYKLIKHTKNPENIVCGNWKFREYNVKDIQMFKIVPVSTQKAQRILQITQK